MSKFTIASLGKTTGLFKVTNNNPANKYYRFKVNSRTPEYEVTYSKLKIKTPERRRRRHRSGILIANFGQIPDFDIAFISLTEQVSVCKKFTDVPLVPYCWLWRNLNPFSINFPLLYPLKTSENHWFSDVFRGYRSGTFVVLKWVDFENFSKIFRVINLAVIRK